MVLGRKFSPIPCLLPVYWHSSEPTPPWTNTHACEKSVLVDHWSLSQSFLLLTFTLACFTYVNPAFVHILSSLNFLCRKH